MEREALKLALEALKEAQTNDDGMEKWNRNKKAITAIKEALAQPAQEPWVSLTPEQVQECADNSYYHSAWSSEVDLALFAQNLDAALRKANT